MDPNPERIESDPLRRRMIHNQVLRILEEDQRIGDRIGERDPTAIRSPMESFLCSRPPMLPSSPLGSKTVVSSS